VQSLGTRFRNEETGIAFTAQSNCDFEIRYVVGMRRIEELMRCHRNGTVLPGATIMSCSTRKLSPQSQ
jgi:hypothetical protein